MSMTGSCPAITDAARAALLLALGDNPCIVVDDLKGDASKGEPVTNGLLAVVDRPYAPAPAAVAERSVLAGGIVVYSVLVATTDKLTHAKAENILRSLATLTGLPVRPTRERPAKPADIDEDGARV